MADIISEFNEVKDCIYKNEHYSVRDNGAVMRHQREGMRVRKDDNVWTFGKPNEKTGYMEIAGERVHRIVAFAFLGNPPTDQHVVDHIDTNRRNNRPDNLRWLTRLENILNNPITRARIESVCGSIEVFLADPSVLRGHESIDPNFSWMRTVSPEEARASLERLSNWAKEHPKPNGGRLDEWVYQERKAGFDSSLKKPFPTLTSRTEDYDDKTEDNEPIKTRSLSSNAIQLNWKYPVEFPLCPKQATDKPLETYMANMAEGEVFSKNNFGESTIIKFGMTDSEHLWVLCNISIVWKSHAITKITYRDGIFYHENMGVFDFGDEPDEIFDSILNGEQELKGD